MVKEKLFKFIGIKHQIETPDERKKRKQMEVKKQYNAYIKRREAIINKAINDEINEFINRETV